jgi:hypothetical protein
MGWLGTTKVAGDFIALTMWALRARGGKTAPPCVASLKWKAKGQTPPKRSEYQRFRVQRLQRPEVCLTAFGEMSIVTL